MVSINPEKKKQSTALSTYVGEPFSRIFGELVLLGRVNNVFDKRVHERLELGPRNARCHGVNGCERELGADL